MAGSIKDLGNGKFVVRVYLGEVDGKRRYKAQTVVGKRNAEKALAKMLTDRDKLAKAPKKQTVGAYLDGWLKDTAKNRVGAKTLQSYTQVVDLYIRPTLGQIVLAKLTAAHVQGLYNSLIDDKGLSPRTVRYTHSVLRSALNQALKWQLIQHNPATLVDLPKQTRTEMQALTPEQAEAFLQAAEGNRWQALFTLLLYTGMRPGEALGLQWGDIDFKAKRLHIQRALVTDRTGGGWRLEEPKTAQSRRPITLPQIVIDDLQAHRGKQWQVGIKPDNLVFTDSTGEPPSLRNIQRRHFKPILEKAGLPDIRLYDLRHTCATLMLASGENPKIVAERLGHASVTLTLDTYSHVTPDMQQGATDRLAALVTRKKAH